MKKIRYLLEFLTLFTLISFFRILPWRMASNIGACILGNIGPFLATSRKARRNINMALPDKTETEVNSIIKGMWETLGRMIAEYPHLKTIATKHCDIQGIEQLHELKSDNKPAILISAHIGNWEVMPVALLHQIGLVMHPVYRAPNNPYVDKILHGFRDANDQLTPFPKSRQGMIGMTRALTKGEHLGMLIDQKYNEGPEMPFFGHAAHTGTAFVELCQRFDCPLVPGHILRTKTGYCLRLDKPIPVKNDDGSNRDVETVVKQAHTLLEGWIKETPDQWLWLHRRWKDF